MKNQKNKLPKRYKPKPWDQYVTKAKNLYSKGEIVEAFVMLYGINEFMLLNAWADYVMYMTATRMYKKPREGFWQYNDLVKLLYEFKLITDSEKSILLDFKKGRNEVVHILVKPLNSKISMRNIDQRFKRGVKSFDIIERVLVRNYGIDILKIRLAQGEINQNKFAELKKGYE